ncbi:MAG: hypothetical protein AABW50_04650 [Nanoarchaeota archaeon]
MKILAKTRSIGGSLVVIIPKEIVKEESIIEGELVKIKVEKVKKDFFGVFKGIGPFKQEDKLKSHFDKSLKYKKSKDHPTR